MGFAPIRDLDLVQAFDLLLEKVQGVSQIVFVVGIDFRLVEPEIVIQVLPMDVAGVFEILMLVAEDEVDEDPAFIAMVLLFASAISLEQTFQVPRGSEIVAARIFLLDGPHRKENRFSTDFTGLFFRFLK